MKMFQYYFFLFLIIFPSLNSGIEDFILRWRNEMTGPVQYIRAKDVGLSDKMRKIDISTSKMIGCLNDKRENKNKIMKFDEVFELFGLCLCNFLNNGFSKCKATIDYEKEKGLQLAQYQKFKVKQKKGNIKFFDQGNLPDKTENVFIKNVINRGSNNFSSTVSLTFETSETSVTSMTTEIGGSYGESLNLDLGVVSFKMEVEVSASTTQTSQKETSKTSSFTVERTFTIPPHSARQIVCSVKRQDFEFVWELPVIVTGAVAINLNTDKDNGEWIFVDVKYVARYFKELSLTRDNPPKLRGFIRGKTFGSQHFDANAIDNPLKMTLTPVQEDFCHPLPSKAKK